MSGYEGDHEDEELEDSVLDQDGKLTLMSHL